MTDTRPRADTMWGYSALGAPSFDERLARHRVDHWTRLGLNPLPHHRSCVTIRAERHGRHYLGVVEKAGDRLAQLHALTVRGAFSRAARRRVRIEYGPWYVRAWVGGCCWLMRHLRRTER